MAPRAFDRRSVLRAGGLALGALGAAPIVAACGGGSSSSGERLRVAFAAGGSQENLDPQVLPRYVDQARARACFDTLAGWSTDMTPVPRLAESWEVDPTGTRWRIRLRATRFHDGRPLHPDDVLYSFRRITDPATTGSAAAGFAGVDHAASRALSDRDVEVVLRAPNFVFPLSWAGTGAEIVPAGATDFTRPIGCGPFRFVSFQPGGSAVYSAYEGYWAGPPPVRELEFVPIQDESARVGALLSGQVAYAWDLRASSAIQLERDARVRVLSASSSTHQYLHLRVDRPPFTDPRLREAVRVGLDRDALVRVALLGRGQIGNDLYGKGFQYYDAALPQVTQDLAKARALVADAGATGMPIEVQTSAAEATFQPTAAVVVDQLRGIGLAPSIRVLPAPDYYVQLRSRGVASVSNNGAFPIPDYVGRRLVSTARSYQFSGYRDPEIDRLQAAAVATQDEDTRAELYRQVQERARAESGMIIWGTADSIVAVAAGVIGVEAARPNTDRWARFDRARLG